MLFGGFFKNDAYYGAVTDFDARASIRRRSLNFSRSGIDLSPYAVRV